METFLVMAFKPLVALALFSAAYFVKVSFVKWWPETEAKRLLLRRIDGGH